MNDSARATFAPASTCSIPTLSLRCSRILPTPMYIVGVEAVAAATRDLLETWADYKLKAEEFIPAGDSVLVSVRQQGVARISGVPTDEHFFTLWSFRGRKVIRIENFPERAEALEAAGLSE